MASPLPNIYLIGFMGTGKTAVGQRLAAELGLAFVDLDQLVESQAGASIADLFDRGGEVLFRQLETAALESVARGHGLVVATGGGTVIHPRNRAIMRATGKVVALSADLQIIKARLANDEVRPLIRQAKGHEAALLNLYVQRRPLYEEADVCIDTSHLSVAETVKKIRELL